MNLPASFKLLFLRLLLFISGCMMPCQQLRAQFKEDFSDPDLTSNPPWLGSLSSFEVSTWHQLHLKASGAGSAWLSTLLNCTGEMEWRFWIRLGFAPSANNFTRIYLLSDQADPTQATKAFYLQLGESGSADALTLFSKAGDLINTICRGTPGLVANPCSLNVRVTRQANGTWTLAADSQGGSFFATEGSGISSLPLFNGYFALYCQYTSSNSQGFYFDDLAALFSAPDRTPPMLLQATVTGDHQLQLSFSEPIERNSAQTSSNFRLSPGGNPASISGDPLSGTRLWLDFPQSFPLDQPLALTIDNILDLNGNRMLPTSRTIIYHPVKPHDVVISEIMADPHPAHGLPAAEYLELYNRSAFPIQLWRWSLATGIDLQQLPDTLLEPHQYVIVVSRSDVASMSSFGKILSLPHLTLPDDGCTITLKDPSGQIIHALNPNKEWHDNAEKQKGGWSLEMVDPLNPCEERNYRSSLDPRGGTPGVTNSVNAALPDLQSPQLVSVYPNDSIHLRVRFSETLDEALLSSPSAYLLSPDHKQPQSVTPVAPLFQSAILEWNQPLQKKTNYTLTLLKTIQDCAGNPLLVPCSISFRLPSLVTPNAVVINELMFDPGPGRQEFVELYNRSNDYLDAGRLFIGISGRSSAGKKAPLRIDPRGLLLAPQGYLLLTGSKKGLIHDYPLLSPNLIIQIDGLPFLPNDGGIVSLSDSSRTVIDSMVYSPSQHFQLLATTTGVSLERMNPDAPTLSADNWHSASATCGFATPGVLNSQHWIPSDVQFDLLLEPQCFTPNQDGHDDKLVIRYHPQKPGSLITLQVYDLSGRLIRNLAANLLLASENTFTWDGLTDNRALASPGVYIILAEIFHPSGTLFRIKKTAILAPPERK